MWKADYDPEGLLSTLPAIVSCISGILIGRILDGLQNNIKLLFVVAFILLISGYIVNIWFPINKAIWSSSFVLVTSGWGTLILAIIYYLSDVRKIKFGAIFKYVGMNAITIYFLSSFISKTFYLTKISVTDNIHSYLYNTLFTYSFLSDKMSSLLYAMVVVGFYLILGYIMYRKRIYIKV